MWLTTIRLHRDIVQHGGGFIQYLDSKTMATHIIASTLPPKKSVDFSRYRIVKPAWIVESIAAGKLLPWGDYRVLDEGPRQKVLRLGGEAGISQASPEPKRGYKEQTDKSFYMSQFKSTGPNPSQAWERNAERVQTPSKSLVSIDDDVSTVSKHQEMPSLSAGKTFEGIGPNITIRGEDHQAWPPFAAIDGPAPESDTLKTMTSEEHNAWLLSDPRLRKSSTANPEFLKQYYSESRLHHLSAWKASLKSSMQRLAAERCLSNNGPKKKPGARRYVMHVDFDSFFCAVSLKKHPEWVEKPVVVAHGNGSGSEIASCNYPARKFGVKNGMWMKRAMELCADLKILPYDFPAYEEASRLFYDSLLSIGGVVQSVSIDEALIDVTSTVLTSSGSQGVGIEEGSIWREQQKADGIAASLRENIRAKTGCDVSVGIGGNILQAKVALRRAKPAGQYQLKPEDVLGVLGDLTVEQLPGVSYSIGGKLEEIGVKFVKDIREIPRERLATALGPKTSEKLADYARGIDRTEVGEQPPRKSVSAEVNWGIRFISQPEAEEFVLNLCKELEKRLVNEQVKGKHLTMKIMRRSLDAPLDPAKHLGHGKCDTFNKSITFGIATHNAHAIGKEAVAILRYHKFSPGDLRGLGVQMTKLEPIKASVPGQADGSQQTLSFGAFTGHSSAKKPPQLEAIDEVRSPGLRGKSVDRGGIDSDPIADDPLTPRKPKMHPAMALSRVSEDDVQAKTPLNVSGTQFIMPSNPDPAVMAALPSDIRSKLMNQRPRASPAHSAASRDSPAPADILPSQIDAEVFNALPDDMKAEVLASYGRGPEQPQSPRKGAQSPRRDHIGPRAKQTTPTKRSSARSIFGKAQRQWDAQSGVVQTKFKQGRDQSPAAVDDIEDLDPEFLAELPEDVRREVISDHRRRRMAVRSGLDAPSRKHQTPDPDAALAGVQKKIHFPAPPPKITFPGSRVTSTQDIKIMIDSWHVETRDEGPHDADVAALGKYLAKVIKEERDMEKAVALIRWLHILIEQDGHPGHGQASWRVAVESVKTAAQAAVEERGLGHMAI